MSRVIIPSGVSLATLLALPFFALAIYPEVARGDTTCPNTTRWLTIGVRGNDVSEIQRYLRTTGDFTHPEITDFFGPATESAVKKFQARNNIVSSGKPDSTGYGAVGPKTRAALKNCDVSTVSTGGSVETHIAALRAQVAQLQALLVQLQGLAGARLVTGGGGTTVNSTPTSNPNPASAGTPPCTIDTALLDVCVLQ